MPGLHLCSALGLSTLAAMSAGEDEPRTERHGGSITLLIRRVEFWASWTLLVGIPELFMCYETLC
jgi:hypothetical protein